MSSNKQEASYLEMDTGYGLVGNLSTVLFLEMLNSEDERIFREELKKEDKAKYEQFLEYEKEMK